LALASAFAGLISASIVACHDKGDAPAVSDDDLKRSDANALAAVLEADDTLDRLLKQADDVSTKGDDKAAAALLDDKAMSAANDALSRAQALDPKTTWGKDRKDRLVKLLTDRKDEVPRYAAALRSGDLEARLDVLQKQVDQEKRALDLASEVRAAKGG
jgi:hypothetical protein